MSKLHYSLKENFYILQELIKFGYSLEIDSIDILEDIKQFEKYDWLNRKSPQYWYAIAERITDSDLEALIKALTIVEKHFQWIGGSVSAVIWTFRAYSRTGNLKSEILADWVLRYTSNPFNPFGTDNFRACSISEYKRVMNERNERKKNTSQKNATATRICE